MGFRRITPTGVEETSERQEAAGDIPMKGDMAEQGLWLGAAHSQRLTGTRHCWSRADKGLLSRNLPELFMGIGLLIT